MHPKRPRDEAPLPPTVAPPGKAKGGRLGGTKRGVGSDPRAHAAASPARPRPRARGREIGIALVMQNALERASLAKALIQNRCMVVAIDSAKEAKTGELDGIEIVLADVDVPEIFGIVDVLRRRKPELAAVAWTSRKAIVERGLETMGFGVYAVVERTASVTAVVDTVRKLAGG